MDPSDAGTPADAAKPVNKLRAKLLNKNKTNIEEFVPEEPKEVAKEKKEEPKEITRSSMMREFNEQRWAQQGKEIEVMRKRSYDRQVVLFEELNRYNGMPDDYDGYRRSLLTFKYLALRQGLPFEHLEYARDNYLPEEWMEIYGNFLMNSKISMFDKDRNIDGYENFEKDAKARLMPENAPPKKKEKQAKPKDIPKPIQPVKIPAPKPTTKAIAVVQEKTLSKEALLAIAKEKDYVIPDQSKEPLVAIFIGHVDSGKSTLAGNILVLSGKVDDMELKKYKEEAKSKNRESWYIAYAMDCFEEEKERGKTVEMGRVEFEVKTKRFTVFDCPGHRNYVQNMMAGAAQADVAVLVISAKSGEFEAGFERDGQTREHAMLARAVGVTRLIIAINKMDTCDWAESRFEYIKTKLEPFLVENCGFEPSCLFWTIVSALNQLNIREPLDPKLAPWFKGTTLFEILDTLPPIVRSKNSFLRIPLLDKTKEEGEVYVFGKVESGLVHANLNCVLMPQMKNLTVSSVVTIDNKKLAFAGVGDSVKLAIRGLDEEDIRRGHVICGTQYWTHVGIEFEAEIKTFQLQNAQTFTKGFEFTLHLHTLMEDASISKVINKIVRSGTSETKTPTGILLSGESGTIRIQTRFPICAEKFTDVPQMGRFVIRKESSTLASGVITRIKVINKETLKNNCFFIQDAPEAKVADKPAQKPASEPAPTQRPAQASATQAPLQPVNELEELL